MPHKLPLHLRRETSRHGATVYYFRRSHGPRTRLTADFDTPEFWTEYRELLAATAKKEAPDGLTLQDALDRYRKSAAWRALSNATRRQRENIYRNVLDTAGEHLLRHVTETTIRKGRERRADTPHSANNFLKAMRGFFGWAVTQTLAESDPTIGVELLKGANDRVGFHTWTEDELARFEARWPTGTRQRLAFDLLLYTGLRRGDAVVAGRQHVREGVLSMRTEKNGVEVSIAILPPLAASIAATKTGDLTFLVTERGVPFVKEGFGNWFREACQAAGCPGSAHGLRKSGATRAAMNGATEAQLMAMFGWTDFKMASHYTRVASRRRLSIEASQLMLPGQDENAAVPHLDGEKSRTFRRPLKGVP